MDIMNRLPVKSLLQFRAVSKQWKFFIDNLEFIRNYGVRESSSCCFNLSYKHDIHGFMYSVDENLAFRHMDSNLSIFSLTPVASSEGVWCFAFGKNSILLLWNPLIKKSVGISVPSYTYQLESPKMIFGFGICPVTLEPTILKINYPLYTDDPWYVSVSTLSSRTWYNLDYDRFPRQSIRIKRAGQAVIYGKIFWIGSERFYNDDGISNKIYLIVSFDLVTHQFHVQDMPEQKDRDRQLAIMNLGHQYGDAIEAKDELLKAYEQCRDISMDKRAMIEKFLKIESELDYEMQSALFRKAEKLEKKTGINLVGCNNFNLCFSLTYVFG
uniref:F-box domain-containing protein n=1 Tax=Tanacetum cinerariifolium TaxID=118510 RepID=A0A6L2MY44_TANCI|nr:hypothetical protein [Tanacetum cinerariifolium]